MFNIRALNSPQREHKIKDKMETDLVNLTVLNINS